MSLLVRVLAVVALLAACAGITAQAVVTTLPYAALAGVTDYRLSNNADNPYPTLSTSNGPHGSLYTSATLTSGTFTIQGSLEVYSSDARPSGVVQVSSMTISNGNVVIQGYFPQNTLLQFSGLSGTVSANTPLIGMTGLNPGDNVVVEVVDSTVSWAAAETVANTQVLFWIPATTTSNSAVFALGVDLTRASSVVSVQTTGGSASMLVQNNGVVAADYITCNGCANGIIYVSAAPMFARNGGMIRASHITITSATTVAILNTDSNSIGSSLDSLIVVENVSSKTSNIFGGTVSSGTAGGIVLRYLDVNAVGAPLDANTIYADVTTAASDTSLSTGTEITNGCPTACLNGGYLATPQLSCVCTCPGSSASASTANPDYYKNFCTTASDPLASFVLRGCMDGCTACHNESACTECGTGFTLNPDTAKCDQAPTECSAHCTTCSAAGLCSVCEDGYAASANGVCVRCTVANCQRCTALNPGVCTTCMDGAAPVNNVCVLSCTDANCASCPLEASKCTSCKSGYGLVNGVCTPCVDPNCATCNNDANTCTVCLPDWFPTQYGTCSPVECHLENCLSCDPDDATRCTSCQSPMVADTVTGKCITPGTCAVPNCDNCSSTSSSICETCSAGHTASPDHTQCIASSGSSSNTPAPPCSVPNCATCETNDQNTCKYCDPNYYTSNGQCVLTGSCFVGNCAQCMLRDSTKCSNCVSGYLISSTFTCLSQHINVNGAAAPHSLWVAAAVLLASAVTYLV